MVEPTVPQLRLPSDARGCGKRRGSFGATRYETVIFWYDQCQVAFDENSQWNVAIEVETQKGLWTGA